MSGKVKATKNIHATLNIDCLYYFSHSDTICANKVSGSGKVLGLVPIKIMSFPSLQLLRMV